MPYFYYLISSNIASTTIFVNQTAFDKDATGSCVCGFEGIYGAGPYSGDTNIIPVDDIFFFCSFINNVQTSICNLLSVSYSVADGSDICGPCAKPNRAWMYSHRLDTNVNNFGHQILSLKLFHMNNSNVIDLHLILDTLIVLLVSERDHHIYVVCVFRMLQ